MINKTAFTTFMSILALLALVSCKSFALGTASGTVLTTTATMDVFNATATTPTSSSANTVRAVFGLATATLVEDPAKSASPGGTAVYNLAILNNSNATDTLTVNVGAQSFSGSYGNQAEWQVSAERVGGGFLTFTGSGVATASQTPDSAPAAAVPASSTFSIRIYNKTSATAANGSFSTYTVGFSTTNFPGAPYYGFNGIQYAGAPVWSRQLDAGFIITTVNDVALNATKTLAVTAPSGYVTAGGGAADPIPGAVVTFTMQFSNNGAVAATGVVVLDDLPQFTTFQAGGISSCFTGAACTPAADPDADGANPDCYYISGPTRQIRCDIDSLSAGSGGVLKYSVTID